MAEIDVKKMTCHLFREDPVIEERIRNGIESNRKGGAEIVLLRKDGGVLENAEIRYTQLSHEYFFGCNPTFRTIPIPMYSETSDVSP